jgi:hypothetical protein
VTKLIGRQYLSDETYRDKTYRLTKCIGRQKVSAYKRYPQRKSIWGHYVAFKNVLWARTKRIGRQNNNHQHVGKSRISGQNVAEDKLNRKTYVKKNCEDNKNWETCL